MQSAKKTKRILSALSMAAAAALTTKAAHGMTLSMYYGNDPSYSNSSNSIVVGTGYNPTGGPQYLAGATTQPITGGIQTITVPIGDYLSLAIDALLTGNVNADAGVNSGTGTKSSNHKIQPSYLGLSQLDVSVTSNNTYGNVLTPITAAASPNIGAPQAGYTGTVYFSTAQLNTSGKGGTSQLGANGGSTANAYNAIPFWGSVHLQGGVEPNNAAPGWGSSGAGQTTDTTAAHTASGNVGINSDPSGGSSSGDLAAANTTTGLAGIEQFAAPSTTPSYANATEFMDSLIYQGLSAGLVTLTPKVNTGGTAYWTRASAGSTSANTTYTTQGFDATTETINNVPLLVIDVVGASTVPATHAIVALAATAGANTNYGTQITGSTGTFSPSTAPTLTMTGGSGGYTVAQVTGVTVGSTGNVAVTTWNPTTDAEVYGVDVKVGTAQATSNQLNTLIAAIVGDGAAAPSQGVVATTTDPSNGDLSSLDGGGVYNLFLKFTGSLPGTAADDLGIDLSSTNDSNLVGYTFTAVAVVPEPMSLGLLALGGVGLMARRNRRKA